MKKFSLFFLIIPFLVAGCAPLIIGGMVGAAGVYAVSKDTIQGETDTPYNELWDAAYIVSKMRGTIKVENPTKGYIEVETESSKVWIRLVHLTESTTRLRVSARKYRLPNLELAQNMFVKILEQAKK